MILSTYINFQKILVWMAAHMQHFISKECSAAYSWLSMLPCLHSIFKSHLCRRGGQGPSRKNPRFSVSFLAGTVRTAKAYGFGGSKWLLQMKSLNYGCQSIHLGKLGLNYLRQREKLDDVSHMLGMCPKSLRHWIKEAEVILPSLTQQLCSEGRGLLPFQDEHLFQEKLQDS